MIYDPRYDLSWRIFHEHLRRKCILLFVDGLSYKYQLSLSGLRFLLSLCFLIYFYFGLSVHWRKWGVKIPSYYCYCQFPLSWLLAFALCIEVLLCWVHIYLQLLYLLLRLIPCHYVVFFFVSCNSLYFKVYFV